MQQSAVSYARDRGALVVAVKDAETGEFNLLVDNLVKELSDGTPVKYFMLRTNHADFGFIRIGQDADGNYKSEAFRSSQKGGKIRLLEMAEAVWYVTCRGNCTFCAPNTDGNACECPVITHGLDVKDASGKTVDVDDVDSSGMADCTFGAGANPLYTNEVIY